MNSQLIGTNVQPVSCSSRRIERVRAYRLLPRSRGLPHLLGGPALSLSRPAQASLTLRPAGLLSRLKRLCDEAPALPVTRPSRSSATRSIDNSLVESSSTDDLRLRGALPQPDTRCAGARVIRPLPQIRGRARAPARPRILPALHPGFGTAVIIELSTTGHQRRWSGTPAQMVQSHLANPLRIALTGFRKCDDLFCQYFRREVVLIGNSESRAGHLERDVHDALCLCIELMAVEIWIDRHDTLADRRRERTLGRAAARGAQVYRLCEFPVCLEPNLAGMAG